ncbi:MAG: methyl-accepting chemotaxis protein [Nitrospirota bacterium]
MANKKFTSFKTKILLVIVIVMSLFGIVLTVDGYRQGEIKIINDARESIVIFEKVYNSELQSRKQDLSMSLEILLLNREIQTAFASGNRMALNSLTVDYFKNKLKPEYGVKQFQFHTPPATSFFRVHKPEKYGDDLSSFRKTVTAVNTTKKPVSGLEAGREGLGLRIVYPVTEGGCHIGSVEFGGDIDPILEAAQQTTATDYAVAVKSSIFTESQRFEDKGKDLEKDGLTFFLYSNPALRDLVMKLDFKKENHIIALDGKSIFFKRFSFKDYSGDIIGDILVIKDVTKMVSDKHKAVIYHVLFTIVSIIIIVILLYVSIVKTFVRPLNEALKATEKMAGGDLAVEITAANNDEVGLLMDSMDNMVNKLNAAIVNVQGASHNVSLASKKLNESSNALKHQITEQSNRTSGIMDSTNELSATAGQIGASAGEIADSASDALRVATNGKKIVNDTVIEVQAIETTVMESSKVMETLGDRSKQIGEIIAVINDIADQTNLLALNAAIEAARAGEQGRGFAVVADEVRKLAEKTAKATTEISGMIGSIQSETERAVDSMRESLSRIEVGVNLSKESGTSLNNIVESVNTLSGKVSQILTSVERMTLISETMMNDIGQIVEISNMTDNMAEDLGSASNNLEGLSTALGTVTGQFRLRTNRS